MNKPEKPCLREHIPRQHCPIIEDIREDFPLLKRSDRGHELIYLDTAATSQKPQVVIDTITDFYMRGNANIHRGIYPLAEEASLRYEEARAHIGRFLDAESQDEIIFTRGATEAINLVAYSYLAPRLSEGDEVLISHMEHHANIVPWQLLCSQVGASLKVIPVTPEGELDLSEIDQLINDRTKFIAITQVSNVLGTINPVKEIIAKAHEKDIAVLIDGAQAIGKIPVSVRDLDADFYTFSGHKVYGPTGIGILYGKRSFLESMRPYQAGGDMILRVTLEKTTFNEIPHIFEAGTPNISGAIALSKAIEYIESITISQIRHHDKTLREYALERLGEVPSFKPIGLAKNSVGVISFTLGYAHPHDVAHELGLLNIACRAGHHCAQPLMQFYKTVATTRASFGIYTTREEIDILADALIPIERKFRL